MTADPAQLKRALRAHLEDLQRRGVAYMPTPPVVAAPAAASQPRASEALPSAQAPAPRPRPAASRAQEAPTKPPVGKPPASGGGSANEWSPAKKLAYLRERNVGNCQRCRLSKTRTNIVFGVGDAEADIMFVGEAPGFHEDRQGEPFVGAAGNRLNQWIGALGLSRGEVYIANVLKCRPPNNRDPVVEEVKKCSPFLAAQIRAITPKVIVALGRHAGALLLGQDLKMYQMRGRPHSYRDPRGAVTVPLVITYHPAYVLRREQDETENRGGRKAENDVVLDDLRQALALAQGERAGALPTTR